MKYCSKCGAELKEDSLFCDKCGNSTKAENEQQIVENPKYKEKKLKARKKYKILIIIFAVFIGIFGVLYFMNDDFRNGFNEGYNAGEEVSDKYYNSYDESEESDEEAETEVEETENETEVKQESEHLIVEESDLSDLGAHFTFGAEDFIQMYNNFNTAISEANNNDSAFHLPELSEWTAVEDETVRGNYFKSYYYIIDKIIFTISVDAEDKVKHIHYTDKTLETSFSTMGAILAIVSDNGSVEMFKKIGDEMINHSDCSHYVIGNICTTINDDMVMVDAASDSVIADLENSYYINLD